MSENTAVVEQKTSFEAMTTDMVCTMDDVVSAFVATYESNLFARKKELSRLLKDKESDLRSLDKRVLAALNGDEYETVIQPFDLIAEVDTKSIHWDENGDNEVRFGLIIKTNDDRAYYNNKIAITRSKPIPPKLIEEHATLNDDIKPLRVELSEVLDNIKSIDRKERQVRGRIAIRKLEDSGYSNLMEDNELKLLVQL